MSQMGGKMGGDPKSQFTMCSDFALHFYSEYTLEFDAELLIMTCKHLSYFKNGFHHRLVCRNLDCYFFYTWDSYERSSEE